MKHSIFFPLLKRLLTIFFSDDLNKDIEYNKAIFEVLKQAGGVYIKFLQALCVMQKFKDGWGGPKDFEIFDKVEIEYIDLSKIKSSYSVIDCIEETPFACGSFAQLYKARLINGEKVAIKILRPSILKTLQSDLKTLNSIVKIIALFVDNSIIDIKSAFKEFSNTCLQEIDYSREIANMEYFYNLYKNHKYVVIPKVYRDISTETMIVQEFIEGPTLASVIRSVNDGESLEHFISRLVNSNIWQQMVIAGGEALRTAMCEDYVYGDPHPGNIILLDNNKIAFVDFGIISSKPISQEAFYLWVKSYYNILKGNNNYADFLETTCMCFCPDLLNALEKCTEDGSFMALVTNALDKKLKQINKQNKRMNSYIEEGHFFKVFTEYLDNKNAINLKIDTRNFQLIKAMQAFVCSLNMIDVKYGNNNFSNLMIMSMDYALKYCEQRGIKKDFSRKTRYSLNESYELLIDLITSLANNDELLFNNICKEMF